VNTDRIEGGPRLIEWTGERCVPWIDDPPVIYEHFHRYLFASELVEARRVLDLASGEGFGAAMLAQRAQSVLGIDIDEPSVQHARANYASPGLEFEVGDALRVGEREAGSFDVVVAFEMLEHLGEQERLLAGIRHVLAPGGILIISTPERRAYSEDRDYENPFHVHELTLSEFSELLAGEFEHVQAWGQNTVTGSMIGRLGPSSGPRTGQEFVIERRDERWQVVDDLSPMYLIAVATNGSPRDVADVSVLADPQQGLLRHALAAQARAEELQRGAESEIASCQAQLLRTGDELADERRHAGELEARLADAERLIATVQGELATAQDELVEARTFRAGVESSQVWQLFQSLRRRGFSALGGRQSRLGALVERSIRVITRGLLRRTG
jgi:2-polyprenyl-3-methyl-5-hydroxy-6-metoxy-1,4-benzoquinol methylase